MKKTIRTIVLQLIQDGQLSFDDVVDKNVPGMPNGSGAKINNLTGRRVRVV